MNTQIFEQIADLGVVPVLCPPSADDAEPLAAAFCEGGVHAFEVTMRKPWALEVIRRVHKAFPHMLLGAGTVFTKEQVDAAKEAGAAFIVMPGFDKELCEYCMAQELPPLPGTTTATEITAAVKLGLRHLKYFPAEQNGGIAALSLLHGPFSQCQFVPTGGINLDIMAAYLDKPFVAAIGGGFFASQEDIKAGRWDKITATCQKALDISLGFELAHVGLNHGDEAAALAAAQRFSKLFRLPLVHGNSAIFAGTAVENRKSPFCGANGHIAFTTRSARRALAWYRRCGVPILEETIRKAADGAIQSFYLAEEIAGFAVHVVGKK